MERIPKPHNCEKCGETRPNKFKSNRKKQCYSCYKKHQNASRSSERDNSMTKEQEVNFNESVDSYLSESSKARWEAYYERR